MDKVFAELESLDAATVTFDDFEAALRRVATGYGYYPDSPRCRIDEIKKGFVYQ